ncbi:MAG: alpha/beta fold hydrolase [Gammaproteobacteria bacterium]|nr:alpha/beta hydrolase [Gammaproteobacteria bacterium]
MTRTFSDSAAALTNAALSFSPPRWLANAHLQSILPSLKLRRPFLARRARDLLAASTPQLLDCGEGVRLLGYHSTQTALGRPPARDLVILLHGWEGSADSLYVLSLGAYLYGLGCDVFRLNFRDHGPTHHLNPELFHSCRLNEVIGAVRCIQRLAPGQRLTIAGFSLGGNFALRVAARAASSGLELDRAVAVCPVLRPHSTMEVLENGSFIYRQYFLAKWKRSLRLKQQLFPDLYDFSKVLKMNSLRAMTELLLEHYSEFPSLDAYLDGYAIVGDALAQLAIPSYALLALDDPIIPARDVADLARNPYLEVLTIPHGGHCGFMDTFNRESWADRKVASLLEVGRRS